MEIELKYDLSDRAQQDAVWDDAELRELEEDGSRETISVKAAYFDTDDYALSYAGFAFRVRKEGDRVVGTLKWREEDPGIEGLYVREEVNVPIKDDTCFFTPDPTIFSGCSEYDRLISLIAGRSLKCIFETVFTRKKFRVDTGDMICEVSLDLGEILTDAGNAPIHELEVELFTGSQDALVDLGAKLAERYELQPETKSKYARGIALLKGSTGK
jgi:triphosphatase